MKKVYQRPLLRQHGAVERVTLAMTGSISDGGTGMMTMMDTPAMMMMA